jgi:hypothetical protein
MKDIVLQASAFEVGGQLNQNGSVSIIIFGPRINQPPQALPRDLSNNSIAVSFWFELSYISIALVVAKGF